MPTHPWLIDTILKTQGLHCACGEKEDEGGARLWAEPEAGTQPRERSGLAGRKPGARGWGWCTGAGLGPPRIVLRLAGAAGPGPERFPGMVSKGLLRLVSSVNRRRMKLLLGIALFAYAACECVRGGREPIHSRAAGSGRCGRAAGCSGPGTGSQLPRG